MAKGNRTCERCGQTFATPQKLHGHLNRKNPCRPQVEQQLVQQPVPQAEQQTAQQSAQQTASQSSTQAGNMYKKCKVPIVEKKYISIGTQTDLTGEIPPPRKKVEIQGKEISTSVELGQNLIQLAPKKRVTENTKPFLIYKKINDSSYDFYDGKTKWNGSNNTFRKSSHQYLFIPVKRNETLEDAYTHITVESEEIIKKSNGEINMKITGNYPKTTLELFRKKSKSPNHKKIIGAEESEWIMKATTGGIIWSEKYEGSAQELDYESMYPTCMRKVDTYNPEKYYTHYDIERAKGLGLKVKLINEAPNALIFNKNNCMTGEDLFGKWYDTLINIKREGGHAGKASKELLVSLWDVLCKQRNNRFYGPHPRIKPFLLALVRKTISETVEKFGDKVKRIHTDGFVISGDNNIEPKYLKENGLSIKKKGNCIVKNCNDVKWTDTLKIESDYR
ncbi:hypothetical protein C1646_753849 [Rhizophagus diaphanus]|nr:hypothetical protein C1646_753849 [Rhizophagus diaphanus] [Rhizophagus sp. MUCL 43196]